MTSLWTASCLFPKLWTGPPPDSLTHPPTEASAPLPGSLRGNLNFPSSLWTADLQTQTQLLPIDQLRFLKELPFRPGLKSSSRKVRSFVSNSCGTSAELRCCDADSLSYKQPCCHPLAQNGMHGIMSLSHNS